MISKIADNLKGRVAPLKYKVIEKYSELRYESTHRNVNIKYDDNDNLRLNIIVPTIDNKEVFGGVNTALALFFQCASMFECDTRIIALTKYNEVFTGLPEEYLCKKEKYIKIVGIDGCNLSVRKKDIFFVTYWSTALMCETILNYQKNTFNMVPKLVYLIQDYEPGFFPWSTEYVECERTYHMDADIIAVFNSSLLYDFFNQKKYKFYKSLYFEPIINQGLKEKLLNKKQVGHRKKQILIYGRPQEYRNAFTLIIGALKILDERLGAKAKEWKVISLGTKHKKISFCNGLCIESFGKVSLDEYAEYMLSSYAGISLMISPHPSYPPMEMSTFGVRTITNTFENKDLQYFNENIISLRKYSAQDISNALISVLDEFDTYHSRIITDSDYVLKDNLEQVIQGITAEIKDCYEN